MPAMTTIDREMLVLGCGVLGVLCAATGAGQVLKVRVRGDAGQATVANLNARIRAWWVMCALFAAALLTGGLLSVAFFGVAAFLALREFLSLAPLRATDHGVLLWAFWVITPLQFVLVAAGWEPGYSLLIPVAAFLLLPVQRTLAGECERFLERTAVLQWGLIACVYNVSLAPALLRLEIPGGTQGNATLLLFLVIVVQGSDVLQYLWGKLIGRRPIAPRVSPHKTWEGFVGGVLSATALGTALWWATPFAIWQAALVSLGIALLGFGGGLVMSAIKRDRGVKDYGRLVSGHGGVLDRLDSLTFAAPAFFHLTRLLFA
jgi:phosphatidate cytidylyltransferase